MSFDRSGSKRGGGRPPGLRGRDIGMYYRNLSQKRKVDEGGEPRIRLTSNVSVPPEILAQVDNCLHNFAQKNEDEKVTTEFEEHFHTLLSLNFEEFIAEAVANRTELAKDDHKNERLITEMLAKERSEEFRKRFGNRQNLPAMKQSERILQTIQSNQIVLIVGSTGCGKTTQVPQILLDEYIYTNCGSTCNIVCTQPRRISAITVAERVAYERCEKLGVSVGYQIRLENKLPREQGSILYCTTGVLLQKMRSNPLMDGISAVVLDEIHERSVETDLLMALLKLILPHRPDLKVILMSATINEREFSEYFDNCYTLRIEGTLFPVQVNYLEDILQETGFTKFQDGPSENSTNTSHRKHIQQRNRDADKNMKYNCMIEPYIKQIRDSYDAQVLQALRYPNSEGCDHLPFIEHLIFYICEHKPPGAILVFLPGYDKISKLHGMLQKPSTAVGQRFRQKIQIFPLHSMMPTVNQQNVFQPSPAGIRKVILSTIIAETSVTIDDVVYVINTGRTKTQAYDVEANLQTLTETWVTKANSKQRKGRAGRVQPGICYNLFTRAREKLMADVPMPAICNSKLEAIILSLKLMHIEDTSTFMKSMLSPPSEAAIRNGVELLQRIEAVDAKGTITPLGMHLARLPIDPQMGKMLVMAALFRCLDPITSVAAGLSFKSPFYTPLGLEKKVDFVKREISENSKSDHLLINNVLMQFRDAQGHHEDREFCYNNFISITTIKQLLDMKQQFGDILKNTSFIETNDIRDNSVNVNSNNMPLLRAIIAAGLYPNMAELRKTRQLKNRCQAIHHMSTPEERRINFHPSSVNAGVPSFDSHYFVYFQKQKSSAVYIMDATMVYPMALIIFGDKVESGYTRQHQHYISVAGHYYFKCDEESANIIVKLRSLLDLLMRKKALYPSPISPNSSEQHIITAIQLLLSLDEVGDYDDVLVSSDND